MAIDLDDEILQDFLVEAGEILELLGEEQLVELERSPEDLELLNAIFRGFHTIKGGAGFLALDGLVAVCHKAEDVFDVLREGNRTVTAELMDVILEVVDVVNFMFDQVKGGENPTPAEDSLLARLQTFTRAGAQVEEPVSELVSEPPAEVVEQAPVIADVVEQEFEAMLDDVAEQPAIEQVQTNSDEITESEFDNLLDDLHGQGQFSAQQLQQQPETAKPEQSIVETDSDKITESEFDNLLDELHGEGQFSAKQLQSPPEISEPEQNIAATGADSDEITESEFDNLLDELHGKGQFSSNNVATSEDPAPTINPGDITETEFDHLLDELHGKGSFSGSVSASSGIENSGNTDSSSILVVEEKPKQKKETIKQNPEPVSKKKQVEKVVKEPEPVKAPEPVKETTSVKEKPKAPSAGKKGAKPQATAQGETTVRVDTNILDDIMNMVGELVLVRNRFQTLKSSSETNSSEQLAKAVSNLDVVTANLQVAVMKTRMQPIKKVFGRFPRVVRDLSRSLKKEIKLELVGEETDLDKNLVEALADPLVHLVRNAVDHGIESPEDREAKGKPREGLVILSASQEGDHIMLSIKDDGKGMNADHLRRIVVEKGLMEEDAAARLEEKECYNLIFMPGFSTKTEISDVSGRGVGMDVVKTRISQMNGVVEIDSVEGVGSTIIIKVPLTLAIMPTLMVILGEQAFALPLASVVEILDLDLGKTNIVDGQLVVMVRERALPLFYLGDWLVSEPGYSTNKETSGHVVVVNAGGKQIGFVVDQLIGQEEVVIKPLGAKLQGLAGLAGATITGDGQIALILDVPGLMSRYVH